MLIQTYIFNRHVLKKEPESLSLQGKQLTVFTVNGKLQVKIRILENSPLCTWQPPNTEIFFFFWWDGGYINKYNFLTLFNEMYQHLENLCSSGNQLFPKWWMRIIKSYIGKRCKFTAMVSHNTLQLTFKKLLLWSFGGLSKENIHIYLTGFSKYSFFSSYIPVWGWIFSIYVKQDNTLQKTEMQKPMRIEPSSL